MPTYQYACTACGDEHEAVQSFTDKALSECQVCGGQLRKVYSAVGVVFKGSGFYKTDSRSGKGPTDGSKSDSGKGDSGKGDGGTSDSGKGDSGKGAGGKSDKAAPKTDAAPAAKSEKTTSGAGASRGTSGAPAATTG